MLTSIDFKFIFDSAWLSASLGDKGLSSSANILQLTEVVRRVVFLLFSLFLANSSPNSSSWNEWNIPPSCIHCQNKSTSSPGLLDWPFNNLATLLHDWRHQFPYRKVLPNLVTLPTVWIFFPRFRRQRVLAVRGDWFIWMWDHFVVCFLIEIYQSH